MREELLVCILLLCGCCAFTLTGRLTSLQLAKIFKCNLDIIFDIFKVESTKKNKTTKIDSIYIWEMIIEILAHMVESRFFPNFTPIKMKFSIFVM